MPFGKIRCVNCYGIFRYRYNRFDCVHIRIMVCSDGTTGRLNNLFRTQQILTQICLRRITERHGAVGQAADKLLHPR